MNLEDIYYFKSKKSYSPNIFDLVKKTIEFTEHNIGDKQEINSRLKLLSTLNGPEQVRQCSNFLAEVLAFNHLISQGFAPHWVPEHISKKMPDLEFTKNGTRIPVEVKHLNSPRIEHEALSNGLIFGNTVDNNYHFGLKTKISYFIDNASLKLKSFNLHHENLDSKRGVLYIYFSKSIDAIITDQLEWELNMINRVTNIAETLVSNDIKLHVFDIDQLNMSTD